MKYLLTILLFISFGLFVNAQQNTSMPTKDINDTIALQNMPHFLGGTDSLHNFLTRNIQWPSHEIDSLWEGRVIVELLIDTTGSIVNATIVEPKEDIYDEYKQEALRVVKLMPNWIPGKRHEQTEKYLLPITWNPQSTIYGRICNEDNVIITGGLIINKQTKVAQLLDIDGTYSINATIGDTIEYVFPGYEKQEIVFDGNNVVNITLKEHTIALALSTAYKKLKTDEQTLENIYTFFCIFPNDFYSINNIFGYNDNQRRGPLFPESFDYISTFISLYSMIEEITYYRKLLNICIEGRWNENAANFLQNGIYYLATGDAENNVVCHLQKSYISASKSKNCPLWKYLNMYSNKNVLGFWYFYLDSAESSRKDVYLTTKDALSKYPRLKRLLNKEYKHHKPII